jgi:glucan-binding YG repeat protein
MVSGATHAVDDKLFLFGEDGARVTGSGWKSVKGAWYYLEGSVVRNRLAEERRFVVLP